MPATTTRVAEAARRARIARNAEAARNRKAEAEANKVATAAALQTVTESTLRLIASYADAESIVIPADIRAAASPSDIATETLLSLAESIGGRVHLANLSTEAKAEAARKAKAALRKETRNAIVDLLRRERGREAATTAEAIARSAVSGALRGRKAGNAEANAVRTYSVAPWATDAEGKAIASVAEARGQGRRNVATAPSLGRIDAPTIAEAEAVALAIAADGEWQRADKDQGRTFALHLAESRGYVAGKAESRAEAIATAKGRNLKAEAIATARASKAEVKAERHRVRPIREAGNPLTPQESLTPSGRPIRLLRGQDLDALLTHQLRFHNDAQDTAPSGRTLASIVADRDSGAAFGRAFAVALSAEVATHKCRGIVALREAVARLESLTEADTEAVAEAAMRAYSDAFDDAEAAREAAPSKVPGSRRLTEAERAKAEAAHNAEAKADQYAEAEAVAVVLREVRKSRPLSLADVLVTCLRSPSTDAERRTTGAARNRKAKAEAIDATDLAYPYAYAYLGLGDSASNGARALRDVVNRAREVAADQAGNVRPSVPATATEAIAALRDAEAVAEVGAGTRRQVEAARREVGLVRLMAERAYRAERQRRGRAATAEAIAERAKAKAEANNAERATRGRYVPATTPSGLPTIAEAEAVAYFMARQPRPSVGRRIGTREAEAIAREAATARVAERRRELAEAEAARLARNAEAKAARNAKVKRP